MTELNERSSLARSLDVLTPEEEILIERLVDDELNEEERDALFLRLEESVDGWRTCALRFLEAQAFRAALRDFDANLTPQVARASINADRYSKNAGKKRDWQGLLKTFSATAAGFLVAACFFGRFEESTTTSTRPDSNVRLVQSEPTPSALENALADTLAENERIGSIRENASNASVPLKDSSIASVEIDAIDQSRLNNVVEVKLNCPEQGLANVSIPCTECDRFDRVGFLTSNLDVPPNVAEELRRTGGIVASHRDERRFQLGDGRVLIIPVDTYNVNYDSYLQIH